MSYAPFGRFAGLGLGLGLGLVAAGPLQAQDPDLGAATYDKWCAGCHGVDGAGDGPAAGRMLPRPRDFRNALYQIRTTPSGALPSDADLLHIIDVGMPGTAMPGWEEELSRTEREALVAHLKTLSRFFESQQPGEPIDVGRAPGVDDEGLAEGRRFYEEIECWKCHGQQGRGDGPSAPELEDDDGSPIPAADLTENWRFNGGGSVEDIYMRLRTGMDGTPMPSFTDLLAAEFMTDEQLWNLAHYVRSLSPEKAPRIGEVVRAHLVEEGLPASSDDPAWADVEPVYFPLVAQIIDKPRWFSPRVDGVWVQALHDGRELALRLVWHDPSRSPDPAWSIWQERVLAAMEPAEGGLDSPAPLPDAFAVQFPRAVPEGRSLPYFLMGTSREPVYLWHWTSDRDGAVEALGRGLPTIEPLPSTTQALQAEASFADGEWRLLLRRSLETDPAEDRLQFVAGQPIPMAFYAWDGSNGETGAQGAISSWYYVYLDEPATNAVFVTPIAAMLATLALGLVVVARAQRRERLSLPNDPEPQSTE